MNSIKNIIIVFLLIVFLFSCSNTKDITVTKISGLQPVTSKSFIYALPQTSISIILEVTKTIFKKGPYAEYAQKYLGILNVSLWDSETWAITNVKISSNNEADPSQYYAITFKTHPDNLSKLFSVSNNGIILDFANAWKSNANTFKTSAEDNGILFDPSIIEETSKEKIDTFFKTVMTDTSFVRIPVFKKQIQAKTIEEIAKETAHELIKTRKRQIKILRGEYDFHPDGKALEVMISELNKQEKKLLAMFNGIKLTKKLYYTFIETPRPETLSKELCYFTIDKGIQDTKIHGCSIISLQITKEQDPIQNINFENTKNILYVRVPEMSSVSVKMNKEEIAKTRIPIYQFGTVQALPLK